MTHSEYAATVYDLQSIIIVRDNQIVELTEMLASSCRQTDRQAKTIIEYRNRIRNHERDNKFVLFHFNEFVAGKIDIRESPFVDEIRAALTDKEEA